METRILIIILLLSVYGVFGQSSSQFGKCTTKDAKELKNKTIEVLIEDSVWYADELKKAIEENWTFTKYKFITKKELKEKYEYKDEFLVLGVFEGGFDTPNRTFLYDFIGIVTKFRDEKYYRMGKDYTVNMPFISSTYDIDNSYDYIATYVTMLDNYLHLLANEKNIVKNAGGYKKYIISCNKKIKHKKILISENDLACMKEKITKTYNFDYMIVSEDRLLEAIAKKEDVLIYHTVAASTFIFKVKSSSHIANATSSGVTMGRSYKYSSNEPIYHMIFSAKDKKVYYNILGYSGEKNMAKTQRKIFAELGKLNR